MNAREQSFYVAVLIASLILASIIFYFIISIIKHHRRNLQLHRENILAEISALENERARIAADLHDELGPLLSAVKLKINSFDLVTEDDKLEVEKTNEQIDNLIKRIREISYNLLPNTLVRKGLLVAIKEFIGYATSGSSLKVHIDAEPGIKLSEQSTLHLFRILQEIIHNTIKHANATELYITLYEENNLLVLKTKDNGRGFDYYSAMRNSEGFGLRNLLSRIEILGGEMFVDSTEEKGTTYTFEIQKL